MELWREMELKEKQKGNGIKAAGGNTVQSKEKGEEAVLVLGGRLCCSLFDTLASHWSVENSSLYVKTLSVQVGVQHIHFFQTALFCMCRTGTGKLWSGGRMRPISLFNPAHQDYIPIKWHRKGEKHLNIQPLCMTFTFHCVSSVKCLKKKYRMHFTLLSVRSLEVCGSREQRSSVEKQDNKKWIHNMY